MIFAPPRLTVKLEYTVQHTLELSTYALSAVWRVEEVLSWGLQEGLHRRDTCRWAEMGMGARDGTGQRESSEQRKGGQSSGGTFQVVCGILPKQWAPGHQKSVGYKDGGRIVSQSGGHETGCG